MKPLPLELFRATPPDCRILDLSAGDAAVWFGARPPGVIAIDKRHCSANVLADSRQLPFRDDTFDLALFDPPHTNFGAKGHMTRRYGHSTGSEIRELVQYSGREAARCVRRGGVMALKWSDRDVTLTRVLGLLPDWRPLFGHGVAQRKRREKSNKISSTWWLLLLNEKPLCLGSA